MTSPTPVMSVIIPTYNRAALLERCVRSILNQSVDQFEVIVVDDGGTDASEAICSRFQDPRLTFVRLPNNNGGPAIPRNTGASLASSDLLVFFDSDDVARPQMLERLHCLMNSSRQLGAVWGWRALLDGDNHLVSVAFVNRLRGEVSLLPTMLTWTPGTPGLMVRKEAFREVGGFDPEMTPLEDLDFTARLAMTGKWTVSNVDEILLDVHFHGANISGLVNDNHLHSLRRFLEKHREPLRFYPDARAAFLYRLACCYFHLGNPREAHRALNQAILCNPWNAKMLGRKLAQTARLMTAWQLLSRLRLRWDERKRLRKYGAGVVGNDHEFKWASVFTRSVGEHK